MVDFSKVPSPCFVLDEELLIKNLELLKSVKEKAGIEILLAFKGFAMWGAFDIIKPYFNTATASSVNEARLAFKELGNKAHTYCPAYSEAEFDEILKYSNTITFNSLSQYERFRDKVNSEISIGLRINPEYSEIEQDIYNPCSPTSRFGVKKDELGNTLPKGIDGIHFHALCESDSYSLENTLKVVEENFSELLHQAKWINMGGGHLMTKKGYDIDHLVNLLTDFKKKYNVEVILEPGAAFAWQIGYLVSTILDIVEKENRKTAILDVSFAAHMPDCLEMPYKPEIIGTIEEDKNKPTYFMGGNSCLAGDFVGSWNFEKELKIGDKIIFKDMMHYTMVKTTNFNGVTHPSIGIYKKDGFRLLKKFGYDDYKNRLS